MIFNDEMDDVEDWAKEAAMKIHEPSDEIKINIKKIIESTPKTTSIDFAIGKDYTVRAVYDSNMNLIKKEII